MKLMVVMVATLKPWLRNMKILTKLLETKKRKLTLCIPMLISWCHLNIMQPVIFKQRRKKSWQGGSIWKRLWLRKDPNWVNLKLCNSFQGMLMKLRIGCWKNCNWLRKSLTKTLLISNPNIRNMKLLKRSLPLMLTELKLCWKWARNWLRTENVLVQRRLSNKGWKWFLNNGKHWPKKHLKNPWNWRKPTGKEHLLQLSKIWTSG